MPDKIYNSILAKGSDTFITQEDYTKADIKPASPFIREEKPLTSYMFLQQHGYYRWYQLTKDGHLLRWRDELSFTRNIWRYIKINFAKLF
jgi:hypothetical protein